MRERHMVKLTENALAIGPRCFSMVVLLFVFFKLSSVPFLKITFQLSAMLVTDWGLDHCGQGHDRSPATPLSALMHSGQVYMLFQVCRRLHCQQIVIKSNLVLKADLDT